MNDHSSSRPVTRRDFLSKGSTAVVAGSVLASLDVSRLAFAQADDTIKIALIGCGGRGTGAASQALSTRGKVKLVAMADAFRDQLDSSLGQLSRKFGADRVAVAEDSKFIGFDAYKNAIASADLVILATPPGFRPLHFEEAVRQGKNIFMEKPVATDAPGVRRVLAAAEEAKKKNLKVGVGLQRHHQKGYLETIQRLHSGEIGDIVAMRCYWNGNGVWVRERKPNQTEMEYQMRNWYYFNWLCGDHIVEQHIHNLDVINWVKNGHPVTAQGMGGRQVRTGKENGEIFDHHFVEFKYADGSYLSSQCRHIVNTWASVSEHVQGTKGMCDVSSYQIRGENKWRFNDREADPYQVEHDDLFDAVRNNKPYNEAEYGAHSTMTSIMGRMATYTGQLITWEQAINSNVNLFPEKLSWDATPKSLPDATGHYPIAVPGDPNWIRRVI